MPEKKTPVTRKKQIKLDPKVAEDLIAQFYVNSENGGFVCSVCNKSFPKPANPKAKNLVLITHLYRHDEKGEVLGLPKEESTTKKEKKSKKAEKPEEPKVEKKPDFWSAVQKNQTTVDGQVSHFLVLANQIRRAGGLKTKKEFEQFEEDYTSLKNPYSSTESENLYWKYVPQNPVKVEVPTEEKKEEPKSKVTKKVDKKKAPEKKKLSETTEKVKTESKTKEKPKKEEVSKTAKTVKEKVQKTKKVVEKVTTKRTKKAEKASDTQSVPQEEGKVATTQPKPQVETTPEPVEPKDTASGVQPVKTDEDVTEIEKTGKPKKVKKEPWKPDPALCPHLAFTSRGIPYDSSRKEEDPYTGRPRKIEKPRTERTKHEPWKPDPSKTPNLAFTSRGIAYDSSTHQENPYTGRPQKIPVVKQKDDPILKALEKSNGLLDRIKIVLGKKKELTTEEKAKKTWAEYSFFQKLKATLLGLRKEGDQKEAAKDQGTGGGFVNFMKRLTGNNPVIATLLGMRKLLPVAKLLLPVIAGIGAAFAGWKIGEWLYNEIPAIKKFGDTIGDYLYKKIGWIREIADKFSGADKIKEESLNETQQNNKKLENLLKEKYNLEVQKAPNQTDDEYNTTLNQMAREKMQGSEPKIPDLNNPTLTRNPSTPFTASAANIPQSKSSKNFEMPIKRPSMLGLQINQPEDVPKADTFEYPVNPLPGNAPELRLPEEPKKPKVPWVPKITKPSKSSGNFTIAAFADAIQEKEGFFKGSRSYRNNNPGNIWDGDKDSKGKKRKRAFPQYPIDDKGFLIFPTYEAGRKALERDLSIKVSRGHTLESAIKMYAPPHENDTKKYIHDVSEGLGIDPKKKLRDFLPKEEAGLLPKVKPLNASLIPQDPFGKDLILQSEENLFQKGKTMASAVPPMTQVNTTNIGQKTSIHPVVEPRSPEDTHAWVTRMSYVPA